jgi:solute carrier family 45 protein 1/2/4
LLEGEAMPLISSKSYGVIVTSEEEEDHGGLHIRSSDEFILSPYFNDYNEHFNQEHPQLYAVPEEVAPMPKASLSTLILVSLSMFGISFCWGCQFARASATFQALGLADNVIGLIWLAGPISGLVIAPSVGYASDKLGRRKPFMFLGLIGIILGFAGFAFVVDVGRLLGDDPEDSVFSKALTLAIGLFWLSDIAINVIQAPLRTLLVDIAPPAQQPLANGLLSLMQGLGNLAVYSIGGIDVGKFFPFLKGDLPSDFLWDVRALYCLGIVCAVVCIGCTLLFVTEGSRRRPDAEGEDSDAEGGEDMWPSFWRNLPPELARVCALQLLVWFNWFSYLVYVVPYVSTQIFNGDPDVHAPGAAHLNFNRGVQWANLSLAANSVLTLLFSLILPKAVEWDTGRSSRVYSCCLVLQLLLMGLLTMAGTPVECMVFIAGLGISWAGSLVLPYSIAGEACSNVENKGLYMSLLNISICTPQILVSVFSMATLKLFHGNFRLIIALSVGVLFLACLLLPCFIVQPPAAIVPHEATVERSGRKRRRRASA